MLEVTDVRAGYGDVPVLFGVDLSVAAGEVVAVLGSNGAGKTTLLRCISGLLATSSGVIHFQGDDVTNASPHRIVERGLVQVPEGKQLFGDLTVEENLEMGAYLKHARARRSERMAWVFELFPVLRDRRRQRSETLSGGEQQMLAIARALMANPRLLMLDEPSLGVAPVTLDAIFSTLRDINEQGVTVVLVEQNAMQALELATRAYVLEKGCVTVAGTAKEVIQDEDVKRAYLGIAADAGAEAVPPGARNDGARA